MINISKVLLINPLPPSRIVSHQLNYLDGIIAMEKGAIDKFLFENYVKPEYNALGIKKTFHEHSQITASLGLLTLAAILKQEGHEVSYYQMYSNSFEDPLFHQKIMESDILGVTSI